MKLMYYINIKCPSWLLLLCTIVYYFCVVGCSSNCWLLMLLMLIYLQNKNKKQLFSFLYFSVTMSFFGSSHIRYSQSIVLICKVIFSWFDSAFWYWYLVCDRIDRCRRVWFPFADLTGYFLGQDSIGCRSHLIGHCLDLVQLPARIRGHPAQVAQEDRQLAQTSLKAHLEEK